LQTAALEQTQWLKLRVKRRDRRFIYISFVPVVNSARHFASRSRHGVRYTTKAVVSAGAARTGRAGPRAAGGVEDEVTAG